LRPSIAGRLLAGDRLVWYSEYFQPPGVAEQEYEDGALTWIRDLYYSFSGSRSIASGSAAPDLKVLDRSPDRIIELLRNSGLCMTPGDRFSEHFESPRELPIWLSENDVAIYTAEFERTGMSGAFNYYRCLDLDWELLAPFAGKPVTVPAMFVGADLDAPTMWAREAIERMADAVPDLRESIVIKDCGHWIQQEQADQFNGHLLNFLSNIA
jgi:pimeloyl-ACP methyl ester carboxylesterase